MEIYYVHSEHYVLLETCCSVVSNWKILCDSPWYEVHFFGIKQAVKSVQKFM